jgi:hypothetical protein
MKKLLLLAFVICINVLILIFCLNKVKEISKHQTQSLNTELSLVNSTNDSVLVYLTLSGYSDSLAPKYIQNVNGIFGITNSGLVGSFYLKSNDTLSYISDKRFSANLSFGAQPINCFDSIWPTGINPFEFNLNCPQKSIDISAIGGVNCILNVALIGGPNWIATNSYPNVRNFYNDTLYKNTNLVGVFPYGCTNCVNTEGMESCVIKPAIPDSTHICNPTRSAGDRGGKVIVTFSGYTN